MKKYLIAIISIILIYIIYDYLFFYKGILYIPQTKNITYFSKAEDEVLWINKGNGFEVFDIKGVNLGLGKPASYATDYAITKDEYLRWFAHIQNMGANVIRIYTLAHADFYDAFYEYNLNNPSPLYLIHGVWVDDYLINASYSALDKTFYKPFLTDCKSVVDAIHGRYKSNKVGHLPTQHYDKDISPWVYGYILGVEWEDTLVAYTNESYSQRDQYIGEYLYTENASNFEIFLASIGDQVIKYESEKYGTQRALAFSNWATTDPFSYPQNIKDYFRKVSVIDLEHIRPTSNFLAGYFASYHIYPYYPNYHSYFQNPQENTYLQYLTELNQHHTIPVVISEFGVPSSRGMAAYEENLGRNQGFMSESKQGHAIISMYEDIKQAGSAGGIVFTWQDEWFKRTWNTMATVDLNTTPYWSDYQTNEQYFGLLSFDPGEKQSICYVDGDKSDWTKEDLVTTAEGFNLSIQYDQKFIYFLVEKDDFDLDSTKLYIPINTTPQSGSTFAKNFNLSTSSESDFIIQIDGTNGSRLWVHERYDLTKALYSNLIFLDKEQVAYIPPRDSSTFNKINLLIQKDTYYRKTTSGSFEEVGFNAFKPLDSDYESIMKVYETGKLTYGNANPNSNQFNSLTDFCAGDGFVEIKIPWGLLNFSDPTKMKIHDDYYEHYGVEYQNIHAIDIGVGDGSHLIQMTNYPLKKLGKKPQYHERLKKSYFILQEYWK